MLWNLRHLWDIDVLKALHRIEFSFCAIGNLRAAIVVE